MSHDNLDCIFAFESLLGNSVCEHAIILQSIVDLFKLHFWR